MRKIVGCNVQASLEGDWFHLGVIEDFCLVLRRVTGTIGLVSGKEIEFVDSERIYLKEYKTAENYHIDVVPLENFSRDRGVVSLRDHGDIYYRGIESWKETKREQKEVYFKYCFRKKWFGLSRQQWFEFVSETDWKEVNESSNGICK